MFRSEAFRRAVASLECMVPGCCAPAPSQCAHSNEFKGASLKTSDVTCFSACPACHRAIDTGKQYTRQERRDLAREANLRTLRALIERGLLEVKDAR